MSSAATLVSVLGFDVGARRIGVAVGNTLSGTARALAIAFCTIPWLSGPPLAPRNIGSPRSTGQGH